MDVKIEKHYTNSIGQLIGPGDKVRVSHIGSAPIFTYISTVNGSPVLYFDPAYGGHGTVMYNNYEIYLAK